MKTMKTNRSAVLLTAISAWMALVTAAPAQNANVPAYMLTMEGRKLTAKQAQKLEADLKDEPNDLAARTKLLGYYMMSRFQSSKARTARQEHVLWIIEHRPDSEIAGSEARLDPVMEPEAYGKARLLWLNHVKADGPNTAILGNAAGFFLLHDRDRAEEFLKKAQTLEPDNPHWPERLGRLYQLKMVSGDGRVNVETAKKALAAYQRAFDKTDGSERLSLLEDLARTALHAGELQKAEKYAIELLDAAVEGIARWDYGNAVHHGNLVLGRVALRKDDIEKAEHYLLLAGKTPGSPQLNSFGPNMLLALELLKKGRSEAVIEYLKLCGKFWKRAQTDRWIKAVKEGRTPNFGANLRY